jgi:hypothetical protein
MIRLYLLVSFFIYITSVEANPMPGPPIFYKTNTYPSICYLPPDSGACDMLGEPGLKEGVDQKQEVRYYFDTVTENCYPFSYFSDKPCSQNKNNFKSAEECKSICKLV